jgi:hypothetical protein
LSFIFSCCSFEKIIALSSKLPSNIKSDMKEFIAGATNNDPAILKFMDVNL